MATLTKSEIAALSVDERLALIDDLWESIEEPLTAEPPEWHREELKRILEEEERNPQPGVPWEQLRAELTQKWLR
ncbi:MAG TPA: addiction module protein [Acidobacteriaceae bacterium]|jgi:putative addiction module component (TIGR02574 family)|nr:addiction module protein [Acidobacteriaceae bacterium]